MTQPHHDLDAVAARIAAETADPATVRAASDRTWARLAEARNPAPTHVPTLLEGCADMAALLPAYAAGSLPRPQALLLRDHLTHCGACMRLARGETQPVTAPPKRRRRLPRWAVAAAALLVMGLLFYRLALPPTPTALPVAALTDGGLHLVTPPTQPMVLHAPEGAGRPMPYGVLLEAELSGARLRLADGALVDVGPRGRLTLQQAANGPVVSLAQGRVAVTTTGFLWLATDEAGMTVADGTVVLEHGLRGTRVTALGGAVMVTPRGGKGVRLAPGARWPAVSDTAPPAAEDLAWSPAAADAWAKHRPAAVDPAPSALAGVVDLLPLLPPSVLVTTTPIAAEADPGGEVLSAELLNRIPGGAAWWADADARDLVVRGMHMGRLAGALRPHLGRDLLLGVACDAQGNLHALTALAAYDTASDLRPALTAAMQDLRAAYPELKLLLVDNPLADVATDALLVWYNEGVLVFSTESDTLRRIAADVAAGRRADLAPESAAADLAANFRPDGSQTLALDLRTLLADAPAREAVAAYGFGDAAALVLRTHTTEAAARGEAVLVFDGPRAGLAALPGAPAAMGTTAYVSADAHLLTTFILAEPREVLSGLIHRLLPEAGPRVVQLSGLTDVLVEDRGDDLADTLGGELSFALDGPLVPTPSWKLVLSVRRPVALQRILHDLAERVVRRLGGSDGRLQATERGDDTLWTLLDGADEAYLSFVLRDGYLIVTPTRDLLIDTLRMHRMGQSLADSGKLRALADTDEASALFYENLGEVGTLFEGYLGGATPTGEPTLVTLRAEDDRLIFGMEAARNPLGEGLLQRIWAKPTP